LYDAGDTSNYPSPSEADWQLCLYLLYWTGGDAVQTDRLYRGSALMSDKWDRRAGASTYGELTISKAQARGNQARGR